MIILTLEGDHPVAVLVDNPEHLADEDVVRPHPHRARELVPREGRPHHGDHVVRRLLYPPFLARPERGIYQANLRTEVKISSISGWNPDGASNTFTFPEICYVGHHFSSCR